ncbi:MAG: sigma-70 family RNA polymerase sigma factor [Proteobacteria bacterium]|nr:sigma-70 family RNA polymerase sigma factor [Pseudomonadota bacterium]
MKYKWANPWANKSANSLTVYIVDDDPAVRDALGLLLSVKGFRTAVFANGEGFLNAWQSDWVGCLLIDIRMPGMDGLTLQKKLAELNCHLPVIIITGHGDASLARQAFKASAIDFLEKPFDDEKLIDAITEAFRREETVLQEIQRSDQLLQVLKDLTPREREVMDLVVTGKHNREIAPALGISVRTVEVHKAHLMAKLGVSSVPDLVRISMLHLQD